MSRKLTTEEFVAKARAKHGNKYDYSQSAYVAAQEPIIVICPKHGAWSVRPTHHTNAGDGCNKCGIERQAAKKRLNTAEFIRRGREKHGDKYDYSKTIYINAFTKVTITCPGHGDFKLTANRHINKGQGCGHCSLASRSGKRRFTRTQFLARAKEKHGDFYDYSKVEYRNVDTKVKITCPIHGEFKQIPKDHMRGIKCGNCGREQQKLVTSTTEEFIEKAIIVHGDKYSYDRTDYVRSTLKVEIYCKNHNGYFLQTPNQHLAGKICYQCSRVGGGFDYSKPALVYYLRIEKPGFQRLYKIGVTTRDVEQRFRRTYRFMTILAEIPFNNGREAEEYEQSILHAHSIDRYSGPPLIIEGGNTELFTEDVLELDTEAL